MSVQELITEHLDLWTSAITYKSSSSRESNGKVELTGVQKLRELVLDLALRGKLNTFNPDDSAAPDLMSKMDEEKSQLNTKKKHKKLPPVGNDAPHSIPAKWAWVRLGEISNYGITEKVDPGDVA